MSFLVSFHPGTKAELRSLWREVSAERQMLWRLKVTDRAFEEGNNVVAILLLLETSKGHGRTRNVLERAPEQKRHTLATILRTTHTTAKRTFLGFARYSKSVSSPQTTAFFWFASVYLKPCAWPVFRPNRLLCATSRTTVSHIPQTQARRNRPCGTHPWRLGPTLWPSPAPTVWHWAQRVLKS